MVFSSGKQKKRYLADINVTPFVDVMLVLLVIFMVTAPMMQQGIDVNLPKVASKSLPAREDIMVVTINAKREVFLNESKINLNEFKEKFPRIMENRVSKDVFLKADKTVPYGMVVEVMAEIKKAGIERLGMVTSQSEEKR
jgi:biopolymer transport protein TolR